MKENTTPNDASQKDEKPLIGQATDKQIEAWKKSCPLGIYAIEVDGHVSYFKKPDFDEYNYVFSKENPDKPIDMWRAAARATHIGGSAEYEKNAQMFAPIMQCMRVSFQGLWAEVVNL